MNRSAANPSLSSPRRFILLPEEPVDASHRSSQPRIRRYQLTTLGQGAGCRRAATNDVDLAAARIARELGRLGRV